jgi:hypothetical protein
MLIRTLASFLSFWVLAAVGASPDNASQIASLIDRSKLTTLGTRAPNRV